MMSHNIMTLTVYKIVCVVTSKMQTIKQFKAQAQADKSFVHTHTLEGTNLIGEPPILYTIGRCDILSNIKAKKYNDLYMLETTQNWTHAINTQFIQNAVLYCNANKNKFGIVLFVTNEDYTQIVPNNTLSCTAVFSFFNCFNTCNKVTPNPLLSRTSSSIHKDCILFLELCEIQKLNCYYNDSIVLDEYKCIFFCSGELTDQTFTKIPNFGKYLNTCNNTSTAQTCEPVQIGGRKHQVYKISRTHYIKIKCAFVRVSTVKKHQTRKSK